MAKKIGYQAAFGKLEAIYEELQSGETDIDQLEDKLKQAQAYIKICKDVLKEHEAKVGVLLKEIGKE